VNGSSCAVGHCSVNLCSGCVKQLQAELETARDAAREGLAGISSFSVHSEDLPDTSLGPAVVPARLPPEENSSTPLAKGGARPLRGPGYKCDVLIVLLKEWIVCI
jgi:hypothetical protein